MSLLKLLFSVLLVSGMMVGATVIIHEKTHETIDYYYGCTNTSIGVGYVESLGWAFFSNCTSSDTRITDDGYWVAQSAVDAQMSMLPMYVFIAVLLLLVLNNIKECDENRRKNEMDNILRLADAQPGIHADIDVADEHLQRYNKDD